MLTDAACRVLVLLGGYVYPAYCCYKALERRKPDAIRAWCEYWLILAVFAVCECVGDQVVYWLPMYNETKVFFVVWLWHPRTQGAPYVYAALLAPLLQKHEVEIDKRLDEVTQTVGTSATRYLSQASGYVQRRFLQFVHSLPTQPAAGGGAGTPGHAAGGGGHGGYVPRNANEAAAMAFMTAKRRE